MHGVGWLLMLFDALGQLSLATFWNRERLSIICCALIEGSLEILFENFFLALTASFDF